MLFNIKNLESIEFLNQIMSRAQDIMIYDQVSEASELKTSLEKSLNEAKGLMNNNFNIYLDYKKIIIRLKWLILPNINNEEVLDLFKNYFTEIFKIPDYDVWQKLKAVLLGFLIFEERDQFKEKLREALKNNLEKLTNKAIILNGQEKEGTVGNWILDYNGYLGSGVTDTLLKSQYLIKGNNIKKLSEKEKNKIKILMDLYDKLKLSSLTLEGLEEDVPVDMEGKNGTIRAGIFEPLPEETQEEKIYEEWKKKNIINNSQQKIISGENNKQEELKKMATGYPVGSLERKAIEEELDKLESKEVKN